MTKSNTFPGIVTKSNQGLIGNGGGKFAALVSNSISKGANYTLNTMYVLGYLQPDTTASNAVLRKNGSVVTIADSGGGFVSDANFKVGGTAFLSDFLGADVCEIVVYNNGLSAGSVTLIESYLNAKWAVY